MSRERRAALEATVPELSKQRRRRQRFRYWRWRLKDRLSPRSRPPSLSPAEDLPCDFAIALIACGAQYATWAGVLIAGLRRIGGYHGPIYVVTDRPDDFHDLDNVATITVARTRHQMVIKTCKTFLHRWVPERYVLYLDADILIGADIRGWCRQAIDCMGEHAALFYPDPSERRMPFHGGLMLIDSQRAAPFFDDWRACLTSGRFRQDQEALLACADSHALGRPPAFGLYFPDPASITSAEADCFVHLTSYRLRELGIDRCLRYLSEGLGLTRAEARRRLATAD